jgi:hypothetical protein
MAYQQSEHDLDQPLSPPRPDRVIDSRPSGVAAPVVRTEIREDLVLTPDRVRLSPLVAGAALGLATTLLLSVLGLAIGASAFEPGTDTSDWFSSAGIWGAVTAVVAFFVAGWLAAWTASGAGPWSGPTNGIIYGLVAGAVTLFAILWLTTTGVTNFLGFLGVNVSGIAHVVIQASGAQVVVADYDLAKDAAWGTLIVTLLALGAAAVGGLVGSVDDREPA